MKTIIAELCQNHKGDLKLLKDMVWAAAEAGATYAKIQSMLSDDLVYRERFEQGEWDGDRQLAIKRPYQTEFDRLKPMDLSDETHWYFAGECQRAGIKPLTTVFSRSRIPFLTSLGWDAIKVASYDCASLPMLRELKEHFPFLFVSTGATYDDELEQSAALLKDTNFCFLHAVTIYPTPLDQLHLARLAALRRFTPVVGFSDHTLVERDGIKASIAALSLGADVIERHFSILSADATKDGPVSIGYKDLKQLVEFSRMEPAELQEYVASQIPELPQMLGVEHRPLSHAEELNRDYYRGRFASRVNGEIIFNWEEKTVF